jgi:hypothetical protein
MTPQVTKPGNRSPSDLTDIFARTYLRHAVKEVKWSRDLVGRAVMVSSQINDVVGVGFVEVQNLKVHFPEKRRATRRARHAWVDVPRGMGLTSRHEYGG